MKMTTNHYKIYKIDTKGKNRVWWIESDEEKYRTHSGIDGGKIVTSGWIYPTEKNVGKANYSSISSQVQNEVEAEYEKKLYQGKYHKTLKEADSGAKFVEVMLANKFDKNKNKNYPYWSQPKLDGLRAVITKDGIFSRNGKEIVATPHIKQILFPFFLNNPDKKLDGELYNHDLKSEFEKLVSVIRKTKPSNLDIAESKQLIEFHAYDIITEEKLKYEERYAILQSELKNFNDKIKIVETKKVNNLEELVQEFSSYLERGYEGQMLRTTEGCYENKRSNFLLKNKEFDDAEFIISDIIEGVGNWAGAAKSIEIILEDGTVQNSGMRGDFKFAAEILKRKEILKGTTVTVRFQGRTTDNKLRFPVVSYFWRSGREF